MNKNVLLVEDDVSLREVISYKLKKMGLIVTPAEDGESALKIYEVAPTDFALIITDLKMPRMNGMTLIKAIKNLNADSVIIMITAFADISIAVEAMKNGAFDFIPKPFDREQFQVSIKRALEHSSLINQVSTLKSKISSPIIYKSQKMNTLLQLTDKIAKNSVAVLISGESGTGKELIARRIHQQSNRRNNSFVAVNCGAIPKDLIESELFGHIKGAFTGAINTRKGKFQKANRGTIFLDEIGELPLDQQTKLLRVLQEKTINIVGSDEEIEIDVRVISATNKNLKELVEKGEFREDLYYRLNVLPLEVPALRHRIEDLDVLIPYFVTKHSVVEKMLVDKSLIQKMKKYSWLGNVRELENIIQRMILLSSQTTLTDDLFDLDNTTTSAIHETEAIFELPLDGVSLEELEKQIILKAMDMNENNQSKTARFLRIPRHVLLYKLDKYSKRLVE